MSAIGVPTAGDGYYVLAPEKSQEFMNKVPFGDGMLPANGGE